jgi:hypothetical protein
MKLMTIVYDILNDLIDNSVAYKASIIKGCYNCGAPTLEVLYDNEINGEDRFNVKYAKIPIDSGVINDFKILELRNMINSVTSDLPDGLKKTVYINEGIVFSETFRLCTNNGAMYVLLINYKVEASDVDKFNVIEPYINRLRYLFETNKWSL